MDELVRLVEPVHATAPLKCDKAALFEGRVRNGRITAKGKVITR